MQKERRKDCPFCQNDIKEISFIESTNFCAIYNQAPILPGHSLIIPKYHVESLLFLSNEEISEMVNLSRKALKILQVAFNTTEFNWTIQEGANAGQTVFHLHLHLIPRTKHDLPKPGDWYPLLINSEDDNHIDSVKRRKLTQQQLINIANHLKSISS